MIRLTALLLLAGISVVVPTPAYAAGVTCTLTGTDLDITVPAGAAMRLSQTEQGYVLVEQGLTAEPCTNGMDDILASTLTSIDLVGSANAWTFDASQFWEQTVTITSTTDVALTIVGNDGVDVGEGNDLWQTPLGGALDLNVDFDTDPELVVAAAPGTTKFDALGGDDVVHLDGWDSVGDTVVDGGEGVDDLRGTSGNDQVTPGEGADTVETLGGEDTVLLWPDDEPDSVDGGSSGDVLRFESDEPVLYHDNGADDDGAPDEGDDLTGFSEVHGGLAGDRLTGNDGGARLYGGPGNDVLVSGSGNDILAGEAGFDTISFADGGAVVVNGGTATGQGTDTMTDPSTERVQGSPHADKITTSSSSAVVQPGKGNDTVTAPGSGVRLVSESTSDGSDTFTAGPGGIWDYSRRTTPVLASTAADGKVDGSAGERDDVRVRVLVGGLGNDRLDGSSGVDLLSGGPGGDVLIPGNGNDRAYGGPGGDIFREGRKASGSDVLFGGPGLDTVSYVQRTKAVRVTLDARADDGASGERDAVEPDIEGVIGSAKNDYLRGSVRADVLDGWGGNDKIKGGPGNDRLKGGKGTDRLLGGAGNDRFQAKDGARDLVAGSNGRDVAVVDAKDRASSVEVKRAR